uniref:Uncharacterized protein n=1 Tax=Rhizophora mucronata TaxID=61149 RepID=A0A2P2NZA6_RHIMU
MSRIKEISRVLLPHVFLLGANSISYISKTAIKYFPSFVDQATPGFELGKKDLQSPALPLGHAAKVLQNRRKCPPPSRGHQTFFCTCVLNPIFLNLNPFPKIKEIFPFLIYLFD